MGCVEIPLSLAEPQALPGNVMTVQEIASLCVAFLVASRWGTAGGA